MPASPTHRSTRPLLPHLIPLLIYLLYIVWPVDLVPDLIPIAGWFDDAAAAMLFLSEVTKLMQTRRWAETRSDDQAPPG
ncbi:MAG: YkvA family protein [Elainella sp. Prado103]|jgi:uncharacterized membrane protein YkvA (DUF1232 family)|nr:YkvA family protein [Elainella sp. Prado103]